MRRFEAIVRRSEAERASGRADAGRKSGETRGQTALRKLEAEIQQGMKALEGMLK